MLITLLLPLYPWQRARWREMREHRGSDGAAGRRRGGSTAGAVGQREAVGRWERRGIGSLAGEAGAAGVAGSWWERPDYESSAERQELAGAEREREERGRNLAASSPFSPRCPRRRLFFSFSPSPPFPCPSSVASSPSSRPPTRRLASRRRRPHLTCSSQPRRRRQGHLPHPACLRRAEQRLVVSSPHLAQRTDAVVDHASLFRCGQSWNASAATSQLRCPASGIRCLSRCRHEPTRDGIEDRGRAESLTGGIHKPT